MTYDLFIGDRLFSSWSMRGWLMLEKFGIPHRTHMIGLYSGTMAEDMAALAPARLVPTLRTPAGTVVGESLAMAETLAEENPDAGLWPSDPAARAAARWLCAEMMAGFTNLRGQCPMQLLHCYEGFEPSEPLPTHPVKIKAATVKKPKKPKKPREGQAARRRSGAPKRSGNKSRSEGKAPPPSSKGAWANAGSRA